MKRSLILILAVLCAMNAALADSAKDMLISKIKSKDYMEAANYIKDAIKESPKDADVYVSCGDVYTELNRPDSAAVMYAKANDINSGRPAIIRKLAVALSNNGRTPEAVKMLEEAIKDHKDDIYNYLALGQVYINADSLSQAALVITRAREINKNLPDAYLALGDLYFKQSVFELARKNYEEALSRDENLIEARANLASTYFKLALGEQGDTALANQYFKNSLDEWEKLTKKDPKYAKAYYEQGRIEYFAKYYAFAVFKFKEYMRLRNLDFLGEWYLADSYYQSNNFDSALVYLSNFSTEAMNMKKFAPSGVDSLKKKFGIKVDSLNNLARMYLARSDYQKEKYADAVQMFNALRNDHQRLDIRDLDLLANSLIKTTDTLGAIRTYKEVVDADTTRCQLIYSVGQLLRFMKNYKEANYFFRKHLQYCRDSLTAKSEFYIGYDYFNMALADTAAKESLIDTATTFLIKAEADAPRDLLTRIYLADAYAARHNLDSARAKFESVIAIGAPDTSAVTKLIVSQAYQKLIGIPYQQKNFKELEKIAKQWTEYDPESPNAWLYLAISYQTNGDKDSACRCYKKVLQLDPGNSKVRDVVKKLCQ